MNRTSLSGLLLVLIFITSCAVDKKTHIPENFDGDVWILLSHREKETYIRGLHDGFLEASITTLGIREMAGNDDVKTVLNETTRILAKKMVTHITVDEIIAYMDKVYSDSINRRLKILTVYQTITERIMTGKRFDELVGELRETLNKQSPVIK